MEPVLADDETAAAFAEDFCRWREIPQIEQLARHSRIPALAAALLGTPQVRFYHDHVLVKRAGPGSARPGTRTSPTTTSTAGAAMDHPLFPVVWPA